jgi:hypothetical protein
MVTMEEVIDADARSIAVLTRGAATNTKMRLIRYHVKNILKTLEEGDPK